MEWKKEEAKEQHSLAVIVVIVTDFKRLHFGQLLLVLV